MKILLPLHKKTLRNRSGVSLIIAIIFVSAFMLVLAGLGEVQLRTIRSFGNRKNELRVRDLADSVNEVGKFWAKHNIEGQNGLSLETDMNIQAALNAIGVNLGIAECIPVSGGSPCVTMQAIGRSDAPVPDQIKVRIPIGTGETLTGGEAEYNAIPTLITQGTLAQASGDAATTCGAVDGYRNANDPCNWNKLYVGESVEIPLYYINSTGAVVSDFTSANFKVRVRTPCVDTSGNVATAQVLGCVRFTLYPAENDANFGNINIDPVLVQWSISEADGTSAMGAWDRKDPNPNFRDFDLYQNTEISSGRINKALSPTGTNDALSDYIILQDLVGSTVENRHRGLIITTEANEYLDAYISSLTKPVLRLSLVGQPQKVFNPATDTGTQSRDNKDIDIPYLEYQILSRNDIIADSKTTISGTVQIGSFRKDIKILLERAARLGGFALENL